MEKQSKKELLSVVEKQEDQLHRYEARLRGTAPKPAKRISYRLMHFQNGCFYTVVNFKLYCGLWNQKGVLRKTEQVTTVCCIHIGIITLHDILASHLMIPFQIKQTVMTCATLKKMSENSVDSQVPYAEYICDWTGQWIVY